MFGIPDFNIVAAYVLSILSALACAVYGIFNWNNGGEDEIHQKEEEAEWELDKR